MKYYDPINWKVTFKKSKLYKQLVNEYDVVYFDRNDIKHFNDITPRYLYGSAELLTTFSAIPFYYIEWLQEINPKKIYDLGCGWNIFKKYYPNIIGVGTEDPEGPSFNADLFDFVDEDYVLGHQEYFESVFSICALHFIPLSDIRKRVLDFASMIKPGGRGWLSLNAMRMVERDPKFRLTIDESNISEYKDSYVVQDFCEEQLSDLPDLASLDIDLAMMDEYMDGNIQIQFSK